MFLLFSGPQSTEKAMKNVGIALVLVGIVVALWWYFKKKKETAK
jgi:hypothetical protein